MENHPNPPRDGLDRLWGRRQAFALRPRQQALFETLLPRVQIALPADAAPGSIDPATFFPPPPAGEVLAKQAEGAIFGSVKGPLRLGTSSESTSPVNGGGFESLSLEIGFGGGEHLIEWAKAHPREGFIGAEPFVNGMGKMLAHLDDAKLANVRLFAGDARRLVAALKDASLARVFLLFPDPWPKKRHWKRRYVQEATLIEFARVLENGGILRIASDIPSYIEWTLALIAKRPEFVFSPLPGEAEIQPSPQGEGLFWPPTRYEAKARREGRAPVYLEFRRVPGDRLRPIKAGGHAENAPPPLTGRPAAQREARRRAGGGRTEEAGSRAAAPLPDPPPRGGRG